MLEGVRHTLTTSPRGHRILVRTGCTFYSGRQLLGNRASHQTSNHITCHDAPHATIWLGQCSEPPHSDNVHDAPNTCACANFSPIRKKESNVPGSSSKGRKCSIVMPDGPAAAPLRDDRRLRLNNFSSNSKGVAGMNWAKSSGRGSRGYAGLRSGSCNASAWLPGASAAPGVREFSHFYQTFCSEGLLLDLIFMPSAGSVPGLGSSEIANSAGFQKGVPISTLK